MIERQLMIIESGPHEIDHQVQLILMSKLEAEKTQQSFPGIVVRRAEDEDLMHWQLAPELFDDPVPWRGVRYGVWEYMDRIREEKFARKHGIRLKQPLRWR